ncbi:hypothetical protein, partial [Enterobacter hormaechei]|uniref:hypothetical protein n=1 Tax=Enterobacter hormaechei TaxID=158836 RepID=UPI001EEDDDEE
CLRCVSAGANDPCAPTAPSFRSGCLLYPSDAADEEANAVSAVRATDVMVNNVDIKLEVSLFDIGIIQSLSLPDFRN